MGNVQWKEKKIDKKNKKKQPAMEIKVFFLRSCPANKSTSSHMCFKY